MLFFQLNITSIFIHINIFSVYLEYQLNRKLCVRVKTTRTQCKIARYEYCCCVNVYLSVYLYFLFLSNSNDNKLCVIRTAYTHTHYTTHSFVHDSNSSSISRRSSSSRSISSIYILYTLCLYVCASCIIGDVYANWEQHSCNVLKYTHTHTQNRMRQISLLVTDNTTPITNSQTASTLM